MELLLEDGGRGLLDKLRVENLGSSFCFRIIAFLAILQILQSSVERSADHGQQFLGFLVSIAVVLSLILCLNSGALMRLFVQDAGMIATGAQMLRWQVYTAAFGGVVLLLTVLFQATGKIIPSFLLSISRQGVVFLLALVVCVHLFQYQGVLMAQAVADILSAALALGLLAASRDIIAKQ